MLKIEHSKYGLYINYVQAAWLGATRTQFNLMTVYKSILLLQSWCVHGSGVDKVGQLQIGLWFRVEARDMYILQLVTNRVKQLVTGWGTRSVQHNVHVIAYGCISW